MNSPLDHKLASALGGRTAAAFERALGVSTVGDLLSHYPRRYARRGELTALSDLPLDEDITIVAEVLETRSRSMQSRRGSILEVKISDGQGILSLTFFNQAWRENELRPGVRGIFAGKVRDYRGTLQLAHPDYELFEAEADPVAAQAWAQVPIPIYPATATVASWQIAKAVGVVLDTLAEIEDPVPDVVRTRRGLLEHRKALDLIHRPATDADWSAARTALRFHEAFVLQTALLLQRERLRHSVATARHAGELLTRFDNALPFELTVDQQAVGNQIVDDLSAEVPMNRLVQGEVGSGKTLVALRAMLVVAESGGQCALLAPTEVLAAQHIRSITRALGPDLSAKLRPTLLTGQLSAAERRKALLAIVSGSAAIVVGTHSLLGDAVTFFDLGLVVVDEQHRFGVEQREALRIKGTQPPHVLVLTATPIPRTVAMTVFGDLDISSITQLPAGRSPILSHVVPLAEKPGWVARVWERVAEEIEQGRQSFIVCPAIDGATVESEELVQPVQSGKASPPGKESLTGKESPGAAADSAGKSHSSVVEVLAMLRANPLFAQMRIEALHGRLPSEEKDALMRAFAAGDVDVLVATTVIEVGVDVPNASVMVVMDADRFGVSQLHQLRGRVGRGSVPGLCLLVTSAKPGSIARERVEAVAATLDGFELANRDLELRHEGDVLGGLQSGGRSSLRLVRVTRDGDLIADARELAAELLAGDPTLSGQGALRDALDRRLDEQSQAFLSKN